MPCKIVEGTKVPGKEKSWERKFLGTKGPGNESSQELSFSVPENESARERKFQRLSFPGNESARERRVWGTKVPHGTIRSWERKVLGTKSTGTDISCCFVILN